VTVAGPDIECMSDADEGMLMPAARVRLRDGDTWEVEDFGTYPARLMGLKVRGGGKEDIR
jgi:hypothetical protein